MVALSSRRRFPVLTVVVCAATFGLAANTYNLAAGRAPRDKGDRPTLGVNAAPRQALAGFMLAPALPRLDSGPSGLSLAGTHLIIPQRTYPFAVKNPAEPSVFDRSSAHAQTLTQRPWAEALEVTDLRLPTDRREVEVASLGNPEFTMRVEARLLPGVDDAADVSGIVVRGASTVAFAGAGTGAPSLPLSEQPRTIVSGPAKQGDGTETPGLHMGTPPSEALAAADPSAVSGSSPALSLVLNGAERGRQQKCLADAVYWESRSESRNGQIAVAQVVVNRALSGFYPKDLCGVVYQNAHRYLSCQFTFACEGRLLVPREIDYWRKAQEIAADMLDGKLWLKEVGSATHYHADYVRPWWASKMNKIRTIGAHTFYRPRDWS